MKILRLDSVGGASGDMILSALIDIGADTATIIKELSSLNIEKFDIKTTSFSDSGFSGTQATVTTYDHEHHPHRHMGNIETLITSSSLSDKVKKRSINVFKRLAIAEAKVHNTTPEKIHFHEVGAMDSIIDIIGSCIALELLEVDAVIAGPLPLGTGTVECAHGVIPVPAPATVELLKGYPVDQTDEPFELVTPTGAALLMTWTTSMPKDLEEKTEIKSTGNGFGQRKLNKRPNMLRTTIMETANNQQATNDNCLVLECNIDDTTPELIGSLSQRLLEKGALDAFTTSVQMKKQRPGTLLTVLCKPEEKEPLLDIIFTESTTFGIREYLTARTMLERRLEEAETPYGKVRIKIGSWKGKDITFAPEHDDCVKCAETHDVPVRTVYDAAKATIS